FYGKEVIENPGRAYEPIELGEDEYFVLGDNRNDSTDSREPNVGNIRRENIIGRAWLRIWPLEKFGFIKHR
ncbi:MAG: signal peptidase I, partial [Lachnospiraceae bacterium]|nr:signal peptidase I [Lachnospiraceae bacterium]